MTVYIDILFLFNFLLDYLLLSLNGKILGLKARVGRLTLGGVIGAAGACISFLYLRGICSYLFGFLLSFGMVAASFSGLSVITAVKIWLSLQVESLLLSAAVTQLIRYADASAFSVSGNVIYLHTSAQTLLFSIAVSYLFLSLYDRFFRKSAVYEKTEKIRLTVGGTEREIVCLSDSGNLLRDYVTGDPVILITESILEKEFGGKMQREKLKCRFPKETKPIILLPAEMIEKTGLIPIIGSCSVRLERGPAYSCSVGVVAPSINGRTDIGLFNPNIITVGEK